MLGILLAAGYSRRFGSSDKLLHPLPDGTPIGLAAGINLVQVIPQTIAVVRRENHALQKLLKETGIEVITCAEHEQGMADSIAAAIRYSSNLPHTDGFIIALADMPFINPATITEVAQQVKKGAPIVVPTYRGQRGHPVGFSAKFGPELEKLKGDVGARSILQRHSAEVHLYETLDRGILMDIDTSSDIPS